MRLRTPEFLHSAWTLARPYWFSEDRRAGCGLLALIVALNLGLVYLNVLFNDWNNAFYTALQDKDTAAFWQQIVRFSWLAALFILAAVYQLYFSQMLQIRWRAWLTRQFLGDWLGDRVYYRLQLGEQPTDNPDQRIAEDLRLFVSQTLTLSLGLLSSLVTLVSFITILWQLSGILHFTLWGHQLQLPGSMVWAALVYAVVGTWLTSGYGQIAVIYPFLVATPRYLSGEFTLGQLMQTASAFGQVQSALSFIVDAYSSIAEWRAVVQRLSGFQQNMSVIRGRPVTLQRSEVPAGAGPDVIVCDASVALPDGQPLLNDVRLTFGAAEKVLLSGPSGCGKSTLFRTLAGIWPFANGAIRRPAGARVLFLPQRPYLPLGSLRTVVCYPAAGTDFDDAALSAALSAVGLPELASKLDEVRLWAQQLSPGEQQRIAVARALLLKPDWLFLDEATAALDDTSEAQLYQLLGRELPGTTLISIAHRAQLARFHQRCIQFGSLAGAAMQEPVPIAAAGDA